MRVLEQISLYLVIILLTVGFYKLDYQDNNQKEFDVPIENVRVDSSTTNDNINIKKSAEAEGLSYDVVLDSPGDYYQINADIVNKGKLDAKIDNIEQSILTDKQQKYLDYKVTYLDDREIKNGDIIKANSKQEIKIIIYFKYDIKAYDLPSQDEQINLDLNINLVPITD